ncbi:MAG: AMP-binding protein, partial [bacterium]
MKIVCFGDSLTACGGPGGRFSDILACRFPGHEFVNCGVNGDSFVEAMQRLQGDVLTVHPDIVLIELGANDWWRDERPYTAWAKDLERCVTAIKTIGAEPVILGVFGLFIDGNGDYQAKTASIDARGVDYQFLEAKIASCHNCPYVANIQQRIINNRRCWDDGNHPNEYGNRYVAETIVPILESLLGQRVLPVRTPTLENLRDIWQEAVALEPERVAVIEGDNRLNYREANERVLRLARVLSVYERPKVAVYMPNCLEYYLLYWAVQALGGVIIPLNTWLKTDSLRGIFTSVQPEVLCIRPDEITPEIAQLVAELGIPTLEITPDCPAAPLTADELPAIATDDLAIIMHTSGTTSTPKGAMMRHSDLLFNLTVTVNAHLFTRDDIHLLVNPMFHCTALYSSLPAAAYQKTPVVITAASDPEVLLGLVQRERITTFLSVPTIFQKIQTLPNLE